MIILYLAIQSYSEICLSNAFRRNPFYTEYSFSTDQTYWKNIQSLFSEMLDEVRYRQSSVEIESPMLLLSSDEPTMKQINFLSNNTDLICFNCLCNGTDLFFW